MKKIIAYILFVIAIFTVLAFVAKNAEAVNNAIITEAHKIENVPFNVFNK